MQNFKNGMDIAEDEGDATKYLSLDTQVFVNCAFNFQSHSLLALRRLCDRKKIVLLFVDVTVREVDKKIDEKVVEAIGKVNSVLKKVYVLKNIGCTQHLFREPESAAICSRTLQMKWENFCKSTNSRILSSNEIRLNKVLDRYFQQQPPFSDKKKREFPDAITIERLRQEALKENIKIDIVSGDPDFEKACNSPLVHHKNLSEFFKTVEFEKLLDEEILNFLAEHHEHIVSQAVEQIEGHSYLEEGDWEADVQVEKANLFLHCKEPKIDFREDTPEGEDIGIIVTGFFDIDIYCDVDDGGGQYYRQTDTYNLTLSREFLIYINVRHKHGVPTLDEVHVEAPDVIEFSIHEENATLIPPFEKD